MQETTPAKSALRRVLRANRPELDAQLGQSAAIRGHLAHWLALHPAKTIAAFVAIPGEVFLLPLIAELQDRRWVLPRIEGETMKFHLVDAAMPRLHPGPFGLAEPMHDSPVVPIDEIELFLCPGMAFTRSGKRIGRGKGYYDRALAGSRSESLRAGVCFREQVLPELPTDPHDLPMHFLATPDGVHDCSERPA
ncbi:5-formyltetrahydrofolate cyclo-ligase [Luteolibacter flavescens]|uniref:5-formyltetrahydrofolate cyclo-ligase n=1 Tax=Luteolibacter flavescens TaxID=1859460 RepID=A0ABT3FQK5_9BACT|nr:5-formyltetrahydrofolate cyclo-ligase [Luteolibacter flavescens]MCW1885742.1 5-formyltetrahydrofolate cyclo-ligase [Luteolibacter flavescens]